ncbi:hypothetical protein HPSA_01780 [Helicobacter pylori SouthAfrica7]|uniref:Uncharacterized protein n=1 Tax=Helicobacter pylori (strain SouthAfrica7) TaxID=907239 RepID=E8QVA6_HELPW|nr:hypothetical protein HPSA_01780 [Helicobacter pylori SouthAfrica7]
MKFLKSSQSLSFKRLSLLQTRFLNQSNGVFSTPKAMLDKNKSFS